MTEPKTRTDSKIQLTPDQLEEFGTEMDAIRQRLVADLGEQDAAYIRNVVKRRQQFEIAKISLRQLDAWQHCRAIHD